MDLREKIVYVVLRPLDKIEDSVGEIVDSAKKSIRETFCRHDYENHKKVVCFCEREGYYQCKKCKHVKTI